LSDGKDKRGWWVFLIVGDSYLQSVWAALQIIELKLVGSEPAVAFIDDSSIQPGHKGVIGGDGQGRSCGTLGSKFDIEGGLVAAGPRRWAIFVDPFSIVSNIVRVIFGVVGLNGYLVFWRAEGDWRGNFGLDEQGLLDG
jgi:hypothetical protein